MPLTLSTSKVFKQSSFGPYDCVLEFYCNLYLCSIRRSPPNIPEVILPEKCVLEVASALRVEINRALDVVRDIASGKDLKTFLGVC